MQNFADRDKLRAAQDARFIEACTGEFVETSLVETNRKKVTALTFASYAPNAFSAITAGFFVWWLLSGYSRTVALALGGLLLLLVVGIELAKRYLIADIAKTHFVQLRIAALSIAGLVLLFAGSMTASYMGGRALVIETGQDPDKEVNPEIATLQSQLEAQQATISALQKTTWKGKITRDATKGINAAKAIEAGLIQRITALQQADDIAYAALLDKHTSKKVNFGLLLGILAALADLALLGMLWTAKRLRYEVAAINYAPQRKTVTQSPYLTGRDAIQVNPPSMNKAEERRPIGFITENRITENRITENRDNDEMSAIADTSTSNNGKPYNGKPLTEVQTETVTEYVKLTDRVKDCAHCGRPFVYHHSRAKYCSDECRIKAWQERTGKKFTKAGKV